MTFKELGIIEPILKALDREGYTQPTLIQEKAIPALLLGKDLLGCAQTGTGKTAAFAVPILQHIYQTRQHQNGQRKIQALIVSPTRELAIQIADSFTTYGKYTGIRNTVVFGGVKQGAQTNALKKGVDILIATPGRLLDLIGQGFINLSDVKYSVLDEADHMLDMGFIHQIKKIIELLPAKRQSLFFSATMPPAILNLSKKILGNPEKVTVKPQQTTAEKVEQAIYFVSKSDKTRLLAHLIKTREAKSTLVFSRTKHGANKIVKLLGRSGIHAGAIHGNKSQTARQKVLASFKAGEIKVLVATDIAARGIDVEELSMVVNYDLPNVPETYVHRIGRTGRASASGIALSFCSTEEKSDLRDIQKLIGQTIPVIINHPFVLDEEEEKTRIQANRQRNTNRFQGNRGRGNKSGSNNRGKIRGSSSRNR
jgi:ATP-dependent RNA helicase RhlE